MELAKGKVLGLRCRKSKCVFERAVNPIFTEFRQTKIKVQKKKKERKPIQYVYRLLGTENIILHQTRIHLYMISVGRKIKKGIKYIYIYIHIHTHTHTHTHTHICGGQRSFLFL